MKDCDVIQPELSAYVDGELSPRQRQVVEAHLASCPRCQHVLAELKTLAAGTAALPKRQPAPQFLVQVRGKISRGDDPGALTWFDHLFRPVLLKIPMEVAALIAIALLVIQLRPPPPVETESASVPQSLQSARAPEHEVTAAATSEPPPPPEAPATIVTAAGAAENVPSESVTGNGQSVGVQPKSATTIGGRNIKFTSGSKRKVPATNAGTNGPAVALVLPGDVVMAAGDAGIDPSTIDGVVVVESRNPQEVKWRAEELAARSNGKIIAVSPSRGSTAQIIFVEVPRDDAAAFKLGLQQEPGFSALFTNTMVAGGAGIKTNGALTATSTARTVGVLTGGVGVKPASTETKSAADTNAIFNGPPQLSLANNPQAQVAATTVLGIYVVPPPSLAPTSPMPAAASPSP
jgi:hypothetical protein